MSTHKTEVIKIKNKGPHPNADALEIVRIQDYPCCTRIGTFKVGDLAAYVEPDSLVPVDRPEFAFLADKAKEGYYRVKAAKLRGVLSYGLLIEAQPGWQEGDDIMEELGIKHWQPPESSGENTPKSPALYSPMYDMENYRAYPDVIKEGELVEITEKIHGENARYTYHDGKLHVGSHFQWKAYSPTNTWWKMAETYNLEEKLAKYPDHVFYGEVYGKVKHFQYGRKKNESTFLAFFDILHKDAWLSPLDAATIVQDLGLEYVPILHIGPWEKSKLDLAEGPSTIPEAENIREGMVIKPMTPRQDDRVGRVLLKVVSGDYLSKNW